MTLPTPYYEDESITLYRGDCLDLLPEIGEVDHVITDPPYETEAHTKARRGIAEAYEIDFAAMSEATRAAVSAHFARASRGWILVFCQIEAVGTWRESLAEAGAKWMRGQTWYKPDGTPQFTGDRPAQGTEHIATAWAGKGRSRWNGGGRRGFYEHGVNHGGRARAEAHPTEKPLSLMRELVRLFTDPGELILDPFAGSGTTGLAARMEGRRAILVEREERYCEVAARRLERMPRGTERQPSLFAEVSQ